MAQGPRERGVMTPAPVCLAWPGHPVSAGCLDQGAVTVLVDYQVTIDKSKFKNILDPFIPLLRNSGSV